ncbi:SDR family oxidoreductase [Sphingobium sp. Sx8-8]|uniref:SDR family oxidoreductase n=1 Tax=Sphingobium sp. Sx8-8 TaxID=2933617 RepID=UPI001F599ABD|nr:SDR family oxidoreductase [Sphingobium sp. Sx8-8]
MAFTLDKFSLTGKVAIVTGAGGRGNSIGRAYAFGLANAGAAVLVADLNGEGAQRVADEIAATGARAIAAQVDIADRASVDAMVQAAVDAFGGVDILVNNAAMMAELNFEPASQITLDAWNRIMAVNVTGALNCSQAVLPSMTQRGGGRIVNALSGGAYPPQTVYGISKIALAGLTTTLASELGRANITVNAIAPGNTMSDAGKGLTPKDGPFRQKMDLNVVMRVEGQPDELVGALILLASDAGSWMTGQVLHVDGGWILRP